MNQNICLDKTHFILILIILLLAVWYFFPNDKKEHETINGENEEEMNIKINHKNDVPQQLAPQQLAPQQLAPQQLAPHIPVPHPGANVNQLMHDQIIDDQALTNRDIRASSDPFYPPWRRMPRHQYPPISIRRVTNVPTRGYADNFQFLGNLMRKTDEKAVQLYGREEYPGSKKWEYYGYTTDTNGLQMKFKIGNKSDEFYDGDEISLPILDTSKGRFRLHMNEFDIPRYDPHLI
jgi:hypothetical protein